MKSNTGKGKLRHDKTGKSLSLLVERNELACDLAVTAADELGAVNTVLKRELPPGASTSAVNGAIHKNKDVEEKVQELSGRLSGVNRALREEVRDRVMLDHRFAAVAEQEEASRQAALHDPLTGLANRLLFQDRLEHGMAHALRHGWSLAVMFIDLDAFKEINDKHGHDAGDRVLETVAARLIKNTRADDTISRYGGDEFLYLLMEAHDRQSVREVAEKLISAIRAPCQLGVEGCTLSPCVSASIGIALYPADGGTVDSLIRGADAAMYRAKLGRTGFAFASAAADMCDDVQGAAPQ
ncbi:MAG: GGDEF domain-containing protein [Betaproteobacteria bacterium]